MMAIQIHLIIVTGWNPSKSGGAGLETLYFGTHGFTSRPDDDPANIYFEPRISNPGSFSQSMYSPGKTGGSSSGGYGYLELLNTDGGLDNLVDWGFDNRECVVMSGRAGMPLSSFSTMIRGTIEQVEHSFDKLTFRFKDKTLALDKPVALHFYAGNNALPDGVEGVSDLKDKPKPRVFGTVFNISPVCVNTSKLVYQLNDGYIAVDAVRDSGVALLQGVSRADVTALLSNSPAAGYFDYCSTEGLIRLGSSPGGAITADCHVNNPLWEAINIMVLEKISASEIVLNSLFGLATAATDFGYYTGTDDRTTKEVLDTLSALGFWWGFDNTGSFCAKSFSAPDAANTILELTEASILSIERQATEDDGKGVPVWKVTCKYKRNHTLQTTLAGSAVSGIYDKPWLDAVYSDAAIKTAHPLAAEIIVETPFHTEAAALAEAERQFYLRSVRRDRLKIKIPMALDGPIRYSDTGYWDDQAITEYPVEYNSPYYYGVSGHGAVIIGNYLYIIGGYGYLGLTSIKRLDLNNTNLAWESGTVTDLPVGGANNAAVSGNHLYVIMNNDTTVYRIPLNDLQGTWQSNTVTPLSTTGREFFTMHVHNNKLIVIGGLWYGGMCATDCIVVLDLSNPLGAWSISAITQPPLRLAMHTSCIDNDMLYILGGYNDSDSGVRDVIRLDLTNPTGAWQYLDSLPSALHWANSAVFEGHLLALGGGLFGSSGVYTKVRKLDLSDAAATWNDAGIADLPSGRKQSTTSHYIDSNGYASLYTVGGDGEAIPCGNSWRFRTLTNVSDFAQLTSLGRTSRVTLPRYGYDSGRPMNIIGAEFNNAELLSTLELWG